MVLWLNKSCGDLLIERPAAISSQYLMFTLGNSKLLNVGVVYLKFTLERRLAICLDARGFGKPLAYPRTKSNEDAAIKPMQSQRQVPNKYECRT